MLDARDLAVVNRNEKPATCHKGNRCCSNACLSEESDSVGSLRKFLPFTVVANGWKQRTGSIDNGGLARLMPILPKLVLDGLRVQQEAPGTDQPQRNDQISLKPNELQPLPFFCVDGHVQ